MDAPFDPRKTSRSDNDHCRFMEINLGRRWISTGSNPLRMGIHHIYEHVTGILGVDRLADDPARRHRVRFVGWETTKDSPDAQSRPLQQCSGYRMYASESEYERWNGKLTLSREHESIRLSFPLIHNLGLLL